jgi:hypothetical protein
MAAGDLMRPFGQQSAGVPLGHDLERRVRRAADHHHANEVVAEAFDLGLDQSFKAGNVRHARSS